MHHIFQNDVRAFVRSYQLKFYILQLPPPTSATTQVYDYGVE